MSKKKNKKKRCQLCKGKKIIYKIEVIDAFGEGMHYEYVCKYCYEREMTKRGFVFK